MASASPRRKEILTNSGLEFEVKKSSFDENLDKAEFRNKPWAYAEQTAKAKALEVFQSLKASSRPNQLLVIGADTVVTMDDVIYEKPKDELDAKNMLKTFSGKSHHVFTGVCIVTSDEACHTFHQGTRVNFDTLSDQVIDAYVKTQEPMDKAGGYGIQARGGTLITGVDGDYFNVMGFPLNKFCREVADLLAE